MQSAERAENFIAETVRAPLKIGTLWADKAFSDDNVGDMKIYDRDISGAAETGVGRVDEARQAERQKRAAGVERGQGGDCVELSGDLERLTRTVSTYAAQRAERVDRLAALYASGDYRPEAAAVSRAMISEALSAGQP